MHQGNTECEGTERYRKEKGREIVGLYECSGKTCVSGSSYSHHHFSKVPKN